MISTLLASIAGAGCTPSRSTTPQLPPASPPTIAIWTWAAFNDVTFLPRGTSIVHWWGSLEIDGDSWRLDPRQNVLHANPETEVGWVLRFEVQAGSGSLLTNELAAELAAVAGTLWKSSPSGLLQIDYDARQSELRFYTAFLSELTRLRPPRGRLSMTALASWCMDSSWLDQQPVDQVVPMLYRMGPETDAIDRRIQDQIANGTDFPATSCGLAVGVSTDEIRPLVPSRAHYSLFHPGSWTEEVYEQALGQLGPNTNAL